MENHLPINPPPSAQRVRAIAGCLLGTAVGDAVGLPFEGLSRARVQRFLRGPLQQRFFFGHGLCSDDTEHTCMVAQALLVARSEADQRLQVQAFTHSLGWRLRLWLLGLPAGIGWATLRAILKQWAHPLGHTDGVVSAGNGPAMRSAILGVCYGDEPQLLRALVRASTRLTHTDVRAEHGALAVAWAAHWATFGNMISAASFLATFATLLGDEDSALLEALKAVVHSVAQGESSPDFAVRHGCAQGISGFVMHTVPMALHIWLTHPDDYGAALACVVRCGGDTDTVGAIVGALVGSGTGPEGIPPAWLAGLWEWPRSRHWLLALAQRLAADPDTRPRRHRALALNLPGLLLRNAFFMGWVLLHGLRRLLPPY